MAPMMYPSCALIQYKCSNVMAVKESPRPRMRRMGRCRLLIRNAMPATTKAVQMHAQQAHQMPIASTFGLGLLFGVTPSSDPISSLRK